MGESLIEQTERNTSVKTDSVFMVKYRNILHLNHFLSFNYYSKLPFWDTLAAFMLSVMWPKMLYNTVYKISVTKIFFFLKEINTFIQ